MPSSALSSTVENYLKQIYAAQRTGGADRVSMGRVATAMKVVPGTATTMIKGLAEAGLVDYEPRGGVRLTDEGEQTALHVLRRHRLVELFLVKVLELDWSEVHLEAEELEHAISDKVLERIDAMLGHPRFDPHGDPIPSARGKIAEARLASLADSEPGPSLRVGRVMDQERAFLRFVERCGLMPGALVTVLTRDPVADAIIVQPQGRPRVTLGTAAARKILVEAQ